MVQCSSLCGRTVANIDCQFVVANVGVCVTVVAVFSVSKYIKYKQENL